MEKEIVKIKERLEKLEKTVFGVDTNAGPSITENTHIDFSLNERAFIKKYSSGFNGQKFFTLILAYLANKKKITPIGLPQIKAIWRSCAGIIGVPYASIFSTRAKENGWVDTPKETRALYILGKHWQDIFKKYDKNS